MHNHPKTKHPPSPESPSFLSSPYLSRADPYPAHTIERSFPEKKEEAAPPSMVDDTRLVIGGARVRIPSKVWMYLRDQKSDFRLQWIPVSKGKQRTSSVLCWDHRL
ncbi:hypothetical protein TNCV_2397951 [Trichonephila clavipes]|uniref:Uncharacterized protein n=1 Tax=Trichonephila clavipes TaxID=2585209 RepID=A0A8X6SWA1_TRICX|nr:hypothetical protein TNCV_2397951 [Trichonephila clavipes]